MKQIFYMVFVVISMLFWACGNKNTTNTHQEEIHQHNEGEEHKHDAHSHGEEEHNCEGHDHEGHNHDAEEHAHDDHAGCEGHDHEEHAETHEHEHNESGHTANEIIFTQQQAKAINLQTLTINPKTFNHIIKTNGQITSAQGDEVVVVATAPGIVSFNASNINEGSMVKAGSSILSVSSKNLTDGDPVSKSKLSYEAAQKTYQRAESLWKDKLISQKEYEQARLDYETAKVSYTSVGGNYSNKGVNIVSPISGFVKNKMVNEGEYVNTGQPILTISQNKKLQLKADVSEKYYKNLPNIRSANFKTPYDRALYKLSDLKGRLVSYGRSAGNSSFYLPVIFEFDNVGNVIPGSYVEIYLLADPIENTVCVPVSALVEEQGLYFVFIQTGKESYQKQEVSLGNNNGQEVMVLSGIKKGDRVVTQGTIQVKLAANASIIPEGHTH